MSTRRRGAGITGPQSALTNFLASHNISAAQIRQDYEDRLRAAEGTAQAGPSNAANPPGQNEDSEMKDEEDDDEEEVVETAEQAKKRKRQAKTEQLAIEKIKKSKEFARKKARLNGEPGADDDDELALDIWSKAKIVPGQMENCEECGKRFTVTPYTKEGPDGGLLCVKCGKAQEDLKKKEAKAKKAPAARGKRSKAQSNLMDGHAPQGAKSLLESCVERIAKSIDDIEDFGDLPPFLYDRLSMLLSKHRILDSRTLDLFLEPGTTHLSVYDCGKLRTDDFIRIFQVCPRISRLDLRHAGQFKDKVIDFMLERKAKIRHLRLNASNLITDEKWQEYFVNAGADLESLQLSWLDFAMTNPSIEAMVKNCQGLKRLKLKQCFHMDEESLNLLGEFKTLEHLSLSLPNPTKPEALTALVYRVGSGLQSLCLRDFADADDTLIETIAMNCQNLKKLVITNNDRISDAAFSALFSTWSNPPLERAIFTAARDTEYEAPNRPSNRNAVDPDGDSELELTIGLSSNGFLALMKHSGTALQKVSIASCRTISRGALLDAFDGKKQYPHLAEIDCSFVSGIDTFIVAGIFRSCPKLTKLVAFGCFDVKGVDIPRGVALIGVPAAQEGIIQEGVEDMDM